MEVEKLSRRERKKLETKSKILSAARHLFEENGYENTYIEQITEKADISNGTFFNYFNNKDSLLLAIAEEEIEDLIDYVNEELSCISGAVKKIKLFYKRILEDATKYLHVSEHVQISIYLKSNNNDYVNKVYNKLTKSMVLEGQKNKEIKDNIPAEKIVILIRGCFLGILHKCYQMNNNTDAVSELQSLIDLLFEGIAGDNYLRSDI